MTFIIQNTSSNKVTITQKLSRLIANVGKLTLEIGNRQRMKATIGKLSAKDLRDVGLTESDLLSVHNLDFSISTSEFLRDARQNRIGNW